MHQQITRNPPFLQDVKILLCCFPQSCDDVTPTEQCYQPACTNVTRPSLRKECREVIVMMIIVIIVIMMMIIMMLVRCMTRSAR